MKGIIRKVKRVQERVHKQIADKTDRSSLFSRGLAYEGFDGGYLSALSDVLLALNGVTPNRNGWWNEDKDEDDRPKED